MNLQEFLSILHDKMVPRYVRCTIDSIRVNYPVNSLVAVVQMINAKNGFKPASAGGYAFAVDKASDSFTEKSFVMNFLQQEEGPDVIALLKAAELGS